MAQEIVIDISPTGDVQVEGVGIAGPDCKLLTKEIESALGEVTKSIKKAEYHQRPKILRKTGA